MYRPHKNLRYTMLIVLITVITFSLVTSDPIIFKSVGWHGVCSVGWVIMASKRGLLMINQFQFNLLIAAISVGVDLLLLATQLRKNTPHLFGSVGWVKISLS